MRIRKKINTDSGRSAVIYKLSRYLIDVGARCQVVTATFVLFLMLAAGSVHALESRSYAVSLLFQAMNSYENDCSRGVHLSWDEQRLRNLKDLKLSEDEIRALLAKEQVGSRRSPITELMNNRGRIDGKPVNTLAFPAAVVDPKLPSMDGKYGYGFNLDGKGAERTGSFENPVTGETGIDHELARAFGCARGFRGTLENPPTYWFYIWEQLRDSQPAWLITLTAESFDRDGDVSIVFNRALEHLRSNTDASIRHDATYRIDNDPRSRNEFQGQLKDGVITLREPGNQDMRVLLNPLLMPELVLRNFQLQLKVNVDRTIEGMIGGYQPWADLYWSFAASGPAPEVFGDLVGLYYLMRNHADAYPDPVTGQNSGISAAYYIKAVPSFAVPPVPVSRGRVVTGKAARTGG